MIKLVVDPESDNECDICGQVIYSEFPYYSEDDDRQIICKKCMDEMVKLSEEILNEIVEEERQNE